MPFFRPRALWSAACTAIDFDRTKTVGGQTEPPHPPLFFCARGTNQICPERPLGQGRTWDAAGAC